MCEPYVEVCNAQDGLDVFVFLGMAKRNDEVVIRIADVEGCVRELENSVLDFLREFLVAGERAG